MAEYRLTSKAVEDLACIGNYTFDERSKRQADDYYDMQISSCQTIATDPDLFGKRYDELFDGLRGFKAGKPSCPIGCPTTAMWKLSASSMSVWICGTERPNRMMPQSDTHCGTCADTAGARKGA